MWKLLRNNRGTAIVEYALVSLPVLLFIFGIVQTAWIVWVDNLLNISVDTAARCGAIQSHTYPCNGNDMITAANRTFGFLSGATFTTNGSTCSTDGGVGLVGSYTVTIALVVDLTITAKSCYPAVS